MILPGFGRRACHRLRAGILLTTYVVGSELIETFAGTGQRHDTGCDGHRRTRRQEQKQGVHAT